MLSELERAVTIQIIHCQHLSLAALAKIVVVPPAGCSPGEVSLFSNSQSGFLLAPDPECLLTKQWLLTLYAYPRHLRAPCDACRFLFQPEILVREVRDAHAYQARSRASESEVLQSTLPETPRKGEPLPGAGTQWRWAVASFC